MTTEHPHPMTPLRARRRALVTPEDDLIAALTDARAHFELAFEAAPVGMALADRSGRWLHVNPAFARLLGVAADELDDLRLADFLADADAGEDAVRIDALLPGVTYEVDRAVRRPDGSDVRLRLWFARVRPTPGRRPTELIVQAHEVTSRRPPGA